MPIRSHPKAPSSLSKRAAELWDSYVSEFDIHDAYGLHLLATAMQAYDTMLVALDDVKKRGQIVTNARGDLKANPSTTIARDARSQMLIALRHLGLDLETPNNLRRGG